MGERSMTATDRGAALLLFSAGLMPGRLGPGALGTAYAIIGGALFLACVVVSAVFQLILGSCLNAPALAWGSIRRGAAREEPPLPARPRQMRPMPPALRLAFPAGLVLGVAHALPQSTAWAHDIWGKT